MSGEIAKFKEAAALEPELDAFYRRLDEMDAEDRARTRRVLGRRRSQSTYRAMGFSIRYYFRWMQLRYGQATAETFPPASLDHIRTFINDHAFGPPSEVDLVLTSRRGLAPGEQPLKKSLGPWSFNTLKQRLAMLGRAHRMAGMASPTDTAAVKQYLRDVRADMASDPSRQQKLPSSTRALTPELLFELMARLDAEANSANRHLSITAKRDRALILVGFGAGGRRRSELARLAVRDLMPRVHDSEPTYRLLIRRSKTDQQGKGLGVTMPPLAARALDAWLVAADIGHGPLFRRISKAGRVLPAALSDSGIYYLIKSRFREVGADVDLSPHSLRAGFVTEAGRQRRGEAATMAMTAHRSRNAFIGYFDEGASEVNESIDVLTVAQQRTADSNRTS